MRSRPIALLLAAALLSTAIGAAGARFTYRPAPHPIPHTTPHSNPHTIPPELHTTGRSGLDGLGLPPPHTTGSHKLPDDIFGVPSLEPTFRPHDLPEELYAKLVLEQARHSGAPDAVLQSIARQQDQFVKHSDLSCCLFRRPWKGWEQHVLREQQELLFAQMMAAETMDLHTLQVMVVSDATHVQQAVLGTGGLPQANRARATGFGSVADITAEFDFLASRSPGKTVELFLLAPHEAGQFILPGGQRVAADDLRTYARSKGIELRVLGCESGLLETVGIVQRFDVLPLVQSINRLLRSPVSMSRADFYNALHKDTQLEFSFDVLGYQAESRRVEAAVLQRKSVQGTETMVEVGQFDIGAPRGYSSPTTTAEASGVASAAEMAASAAAAALEAADSAAAPPPVAVEPPSADGLPQHEQPTHRGAAYALLLAGLGAIVYALRRGRGPSPHVKR